MRTWHLSFPLGSHMSMQEGIMTECPVCGMPLEENKAAAGWTMAPAATAWLDGQTYYFCSAACKSAFEKDPQKYAGPPKRA